MINRINLSDAPGKYDDVAEQTLLSTAAAAVLLIIIGGDRGSGFSVCALDHPGRELVKKMPALLRDMADQIEAQTP